MKIYNISALSENARSSTIMACVGDEGVSIKACSCRPCNAGEFKLQP